MDREWSAFKEVLPSAPPNAEIPLQVFVDDRLRKVTAFGVEEGVPQLSLFPPLSLVPQVESAPNAKI